MNEGTIADVLADGRFKPGPDARRTHLFRPTHGMKHTPEYRTWCGMIERCENSKSHKFKNYGARGIRVCDRWRHDFSAFIADVGRKPSATHSIDRIDVNGDYEPNNVRWATPQQQARNQTTSKRLTLAGLTFTEAEWGERLGIDPGTIRMRLRRGWSVEKALTHPLFNRGQT